ncbi:electron transfer flavoprotein subunit alpha/FixB family protein [Wukongibacter sp. M2B1]|uniref:electron transfer flavoprotein subunit alpha/FixB family protein n=1 Tax=Wukongibacter sp. M2B1 TaxID=3088895 RepID=UPI003D7B720B
MNLADYKGVWVFAEQRDGEVQKVALELLGSGREIADKLGAELTAVLLGDKIENQAKELLAYGADKVICIEDKKLARYSTEAYTKEICDLINDRKPEIVFIGATYIGRDLGPRVAARISTGLTADCTGLDIQEGTGHLLMTRPAFGGNLMATIICTDHRPQMSTVRPGVFDKLERDEARIDAAKIEKLSASLTEKEMRVKLLEVVKEVKELVDISEAEVLVSGGRGMGSKENFTILQELADVLGGTVAGSRAAIDNGWIDHALQVGQTGKTVRPRIYVACGISGAIQHLAGMQDSDFIIAVNKDSGAPIMQAADVGLVGDLNKIVPELTAQVKAMRTA